MSNRIQILNATADDFAVEVVSSAPINGSVGDNENGRIVKYGQHIYIWCNHQGIWAKFSNVSDFTSLETRLSQQEDANDTDVSSLESVDSSLETRISEEESVMLSAIASEESRASAEQGSIETRISSMISLREQDVSSETSFQESLVTSVSTGISTVISARISAVDSLEARATTAETSLESRLSTEEDARSAADSSLTTRLAAEESARASGEHSVVSSLVNANGNRVSEDASLETRLSSEEDRVDAILAASTADKDSFTEVVTFINAIDLAHDTQTSTEVSTLATDIVSMESSLGAIDASLETRLSNEEDARSSDDASLETRLSEEEDALNADALSLTTRKSAEESTRLAADNSLGGRIGVNEAARVNADTSIETRLSNEEDAMAADDLSLETLLSGDSSDRDSSDSSIETRTSEEESAMLSAVASEETARINADISLELLASAEEVERAAADTSLETSVSDEEIAMASADTSLESRLSIEESSETVSKDSLEARLSNEEAARASGDSSVETRFSNEISTEKSKIDAILDAADADKDTFVELVSFITEFDVDADDVLSSYQLVIDSRISAEESNVLVGDVSLEAELSSKIVERQSAVASLESNHSGEISTLASSVDSLETREGNKHLRIDFTNQTSFTVLQADLPSGFIAGHGMTQIFQEVSTNKYRRLVSPMNYNPTTGEMTFNLGTTQKSGFAVFYSHTGGGTLTQSTSIPGNNTGSSTSSYAEHRITDATLNLGADIGDTTSVVFDMTGVTAANIDDYLNYDALYIVNSSFGSQNTYSSTINRTWNSDYSQFTISWTNAQVPSAYSSGYYFQFLWGGSNSENSFMSIKLYFDATTQELNQTSDGLGEYLTNNTEGFPINPPYLSGTGTATYSSNRNWAFFGSGGKRKYNYGPEWTFDLEDYPSLSQHLRNYTYLTGAGYNNNGDSIFTVGTMACQFTRNGVDYYTAPSISSLHPVYSEITSGRTAAQLNRVTAVVGGDLAIGWWNKSSGSNTNSLAPTSNTTVTFYVLSSTTSNKLITDDASSSNNYSNWVGNTSYATDIKIVIDTTDQSYEIYRNSNVGGSPTWVAVDRAYLSNQEVS